jgi:hypothetical protein
MPPSTASPARSKSRNQVQAAKSKSALPILKTTNLKTSSSAAAVAVAATDDRRRGRWASLSKSPPPFQPEILKTSSAAQQQQQHQMPPYCASDHASLTKTNNGSATAIVPSGTGADAGTFQHQQHHPAPASSIPVPSPSQAPSDRGEEHPLADSTTPRSVSISAPTPPTGRKLRHLFRRPPVRSASDPPLYPSYSAMRPVTDGGGGSTMKRPASEVVVPPVPREVVVLEQRSRMPRLPSARDLLRKLT